MTTETVPAGFSKVEWDKLVRRGRKLIKQKSGIQWALGDLVIDAVQGRDRGHGEVAEVIESLAHQIGANPGSLRTYYHTASQWPPAKRREDVCFTVHSVLSGVRSRFILIRKDPLDPFTGEHRWTVNEAQRTANRSFDSPTNREERLDHTRRLLHDDADAAAAVAEMLGRPAVRSRLVADQHTRHLLREAQYEHWRDVESEIEDEAELASVPEEEIEQSAEPDAPLGVDYSEAPLEILRLIGAFASFFVALQHTIPEVHSQDYTQETKAAVLDNISKARMLLDWCETAITTGKTDMDKALARMLED